MKKARRKQYLSGPIKGSRSMNEQSIRSGSAQGLLDTVGGPSDYLEAMYNGGMAQWNHLKGLLTGVYDSGESIDVPHGSEELQKRFRGSMPAKTGTGLEAASRFVSGVATPDPTDFVPGMAGILAGRKAIRNMGMSGNARRAEEMLNQGQDAQKVWDAEGIFKMPGSNQPRMEIPDYDAKFSEDPEGLLGDVLDHPELFKALPELKSVQLKRDTGIDTPAQYGSFNNTITYNPDQIASETELTKSLLHETQHATQNAEGLLGGSNTTIAPSQFAEHRAQTLNDLELKEKKLLSEIDKDLPDNFSEKNDNVVQSIIKNITDSERFYDIAELSDEQILKNADSIRDEIGGWRAQIEIELGPMMAKKDPKFPDYIRKVGVNLGNRLQTRADYDRDKHKIIPTSEEYDHPIVLKRLLAEREGIDQLVKDRDAIKKMMRIEKSEKQSELFEVGRGGPTNNYLRQIGEVEARIVERRKREKPGKNGRIGELPISHSNVKPQNMIYRTKKGDAGDYDGLLQ